MRVGRGVGWDACKCKAVCMDYEEEAGMGGACDAV